MIQISLTDIKDTPTRSALETIRDAHNASELNLGGFKLMTIDLDVAVTEMAIGHKLGFIPTDIIVTKHVGGTVTWNYDSFTKDALSLTTSGAVSLRALVGRIP